MLSVASDKPDHDHDGTAAQKGAYIRHARLDICQHLDLQFLRCLSVPHGREGEESDEEDDEVEGGAKGDPLTHAQTHAQRPCPHLINRGQIPTFFWRV